MAAITHESVQNLVSILDEILLPTNNIQHQLLPNSWLICLDELFTVLQSICIENDISTEDISNGKYPLSYCVKVAIAIYNAYKSGRSDEYFIPLKECLKVIRHKLNIYI